MSEFPHGLLPVVFPNVLVLFSSYSGEAVHSSGGETAGLTGDLATSLEDCGHVLCELGAEAADKK